MTTAQEQARAWQEEERRQSVILTHAINEAIHQASREFSAPILNAVAGALVSIEASILAAVADPRQRKELRKAMERAHTVILGCIRQ